MDKIFRLVRNQISKSYIQDEMLYFYSATMYKLFVTLVFDLNNFLWYHKLFCFQKYIPAWKLSYLFTERDFERIMKDNSEPLKKFCFGKVVRLIIGDTPFIMLLFYCVGNEQHIYKRHIRYKKEFSVNYICPQLDFSKKIDNNCFISQGEGFHRYECNSKKLFSLFTGKNYYKYK